MGKKSATANRGRQAKIDELRHAQKSKDRRSRIAIITAAVTVVAVIGGAVAFAVWRDIANTPSLAAVRTYEATRGHTTDPVTYDQTPPAGGPHNPVWLNCGEYDKPVENTLAVHSLEHGAVWVTYRPGISDADLDTLRDALPDTYTLLTPYEGLSAPVVVSAWGTQLSLTGADDPRLPEFIKSYRQGPQTPEPGAACTGGSDGELPPAPPPSPAPTTTGAPPATGAPAPTATP
ncbi:MAG: DUF3105 domain-containing protein [Dermatophilaceae bacterium]